MTSNYLKIVFVIDESGSMNGTESDVIGGFNGFIQRQKQEHQGKIAVSLFKFNAQVKTIIEHAEVDTIKELNLQNYQPAGSTALMDAIGKAILTTDKHLNSAELKPDKVLVVIITDGMENASTRFSKSNIQTMIQTHEQQMGWEFVYLGADLDNFDDAQNLGLKKSSSFEKQNMSKVFEYLADETLLYRVTAKMNIDEMIDKISEESENNC